MSIEYGKRKKPGKKALFNTKSLNLPTLKEGIRYIKILSGGLSLGGGILGAFYLLALGIPMIAVGIFGVACLFVHIIYLKKEVM